MQWRELVEEKAAKYGVPPSWMLGIIFAESGGKADAANYCCTGLMAVMTQPPVHGKTKAQMLDPDQNLEYGASLLAKSVAAGNDLPAAASVHVAGAGQDFQPHSSLSSPWGYAEHMWLDHPAGDGSVGYIDRVVRANNMFVRLLGQALPLPADVPPHPYEPPPPVVARAGLGTMAAGAVVGLGLAVTLGRRLF